MTKNIQRKICLKNRFSLDIETRKQYSQIICNKLFDLNLKGNIMSYYPVNDEVDISYFNFNKFVSYPVIMFDNEMEIYLPINNDFTLNYYKIPEPNTHTAIKVEKNFISTVIVPLVGFDEKCNRLGHGKGYYDRFLENLKVRKIGVAFECQKLDKIITDKYDIPLDMIISEKNIYTK